MDREAMKHTQPEALRLADALDELDRQFSRTGLCGEVAAELRRLHEVNLELLEALNEFVAVADGINARPLSWLAKARAAIAKATGEKA